MYYLTENKEMLGFGSLDCYPNIFNFTTTRKGGFSKGNYASLNGSYYSGDEKELVDRNWDRILSHSNIQPRLVVRPYQTHEDKVLKIDEAFLELTHQEQENAIQGVDGLITNIPKVLLTVATADCVPITISEPDYLNEYIDVVGVNNRDLKRFVTDVGISVNLADAIPREFLKISESGLSSAGTLKELRALGYQGFLMGESFMGTSDPGLALTNLIKELC